jgi:hypothetical protein
MTVNGVFEVTDCVVGVQGPVENAIAGIATLAIAVSSG